MDLSSYPLLVTFGENLKRLRDRARLTQEQLAERLKLKKPTPISLWEGPRAGIIPKPATVKRLATALNAQPWELLANVETDYDRLRKGDPTRDPARHGSEVERRNGGADAAQTRVRELEAELTELRTQLSEAQDVAGDLVEHLEALGSFRTTAHDTGGKVRGARKAATGRRRRP